MDATDSRTGVHGNKHHAGLVTAARPLHAPYLCGVHSPPSGPSPCPQTASPTPPLHWPLTSRRLQSMPISSASSRSLAVVGMMP